MHPNADQDAASEGQPGMSVDAPMIASALILEDIPETQAWLADIVRRAHPHAALHFASSVAEGSIFVSDASVNLDLALLDLGLADGSGLEVLAHCRRRQPSAACVVTTIFDDDRNLFTALRAGAQGYLLKDRPAEELVGALRGILIGQPPLSPAIAVRLLQHFSAPPQKVLEVHLSARESEVLTLISKGYTNFETAAALNLASSTVAGYIKDIYRKLQISNRTEAVLEAQRRGLLQAS